jgi:hypothetical protein
LQPPLVSGTKAAMTRNIVGSPILVAAQDRLELGTSWAIRSI